MKTIIASIILCASFPVNAYESIGDRSNRTAYESIRDRTNHEGYESQKGYAYENKCFRYEYRENYVPGNSMSPGYVKSYNEKVSVPCNSHSSALKHYHYETKPQTSFVEYPAATKCTATTTLGGLIGGGIAASLSKKDAYSWTIPLGAVLGAGLGNAECK